MVVYIGLNSLAYVQATDVLSYLKITNYTQEDVALLENQIIPYVCNYIDGLAGTTWGVRQVAELKTIGRQAVYSLYLVGAPVYLTHTPVIPEGTSNTLVSLKVFNGAYFEEWVGVYEEGRTGSYWVDTVGGIVYVIGWWWALGYEVMVTYNYGYNVSGTPNMDGRVYELALLKSAQMFLSNERYTSLVSQGIGGIEMTDFWSYAEKRVKELESYIAGLKHISGAWIS